MATPGIAVPGTVVPSGSLTVPGGAQGLQGIQGVQGPTGATGSQGVQGVSGAIYNSIGNCSFEVDQWWCGTLGVTGAYGGAFRMTDRWFGGIQGNTGDVTYQQMAANVLIPSTTAAITGKFLQIKVSAQQATMRAGDYLYLQQAVEGSALRELIGGVHSISILARSSVANLKFGITLQDTSASTHALTKLATLGAANTWTVLTFPNIPIWQASGTWNATPGTVGYYFLICLAAGTTYTAPANNAWATTPAFGAVGQDNFLSKAVGSTLDLAFIQHEPGAVCNQFQDVSFEKNLDSCLRFFQKSYEYEVLPGTGGGLGGYLSAVVPSSPVSYAIPGATFQKPMAKDPAIVIYNHSTGAYGLVRNNTAGNDAAVNAAPASQKGILYLSFSTAQAAGNWMIFHYTADTGW